MFPKQYYFSRKSVQPKYSFTPTGDLELNRLLRSQPYWKQSVASTIIENKILVLADWTIENWSSDKHKLVLNKLVALLDAGFSIYAWQSGQLEELNKDNIVQLLKEPQFQERMASPAAPKEIEFVTITQTPHATKDTILILDDYQISGLIHPQVFEQPRNLDVVEIGTYGHKTELLFAVLDQMSPPITTFNDTDMSEDSYKLVTMLELRFPNIAIKSRFTSATLTDSEIKLLVTHGKAIIGQRNLKLDQLVFLEEVVLSKISRDSLEQIAPHLPSVKKLTLLAVAFESGHLKVAFPLLESFKLRSSKMDSSVLASIIKNSPQLLKVCFYSSEVKDTGNLPPIDAKNLETIKLKAGVFSKRNLQDLLLNHPIKHLSFSDGAITEDSITELDYRILTSIKQIEINNCTCNADYLRRVFEHLPQLEHVRIQGGNIKAFNGSFSLNCLKTLEIDLKRFNDLAECFTSMNIEHLCLFNQHIALIPKLKAINLSHLRHFSMSNNQLDLDCLNDLLQRATKLQNLDLSRCTNLDQIQDTIAQSTIDTLNLSHTDITASALMHWLNKTPNLKRLDLSQCTQLNPTAQLNTMLRRLQVHYPDHIKAERIKAATNYINVLYYETVAKESRNPLNIDLSKYINHSVTSSDLPDLNKEHIDAPEQMTQHGENDSSTGIPNDQKSDKKETTERVINADTNTQQDEVHKATVSFFPVHEHSAMPNVADYRELVFNTLELNQGTCGISNPFKFFNQGDMQLEACSAEKTSVDVFAVGVRLPSSADYDYYYRKTDLTLTTEWQPLLSLSPNEELTHYHSEPAQEPVALKYSKRDSLYYIRSQNTNASAISIDYLVKVPKPTKTLPKELQDLVEDFTGSEAKTGYGEGALKLAVQAPTAQDYMDAILSQKKGACRHRTAAFKYLTQERYPNLPVRGRFLIGVHAVVEVFIDDTWIVCDLGGYSIQLELTFENNPRTNDLKPATEPLLESNPLSELDEEDAQIVAFLQTWKKSKQPECSLDDYCQQLFELRPQKKFLIELGNSASLQALALGINAYCQQNGRAIYTIKKPDDLTCSAPFVTNKDNIGLINPGPGGPLHHFLTQSYDSSTPPILLINAEHFDTDTLVQHNSLFDDKPKADGTSLPHGTVILLLVNRSKPNLSLGEDLSSRMDLIERCPVSDKALNQAYPWIKPAQVTNECNPSAEINLFYSEHWETMLLGQWIIKNNDLFFEEGLLQKAIRKHPALTIAGGLWEHHGFQNLWQEALQNGFIDYEGQRIILPEQFSINLTEGYDWAQLTKPLSFNDALDYEAACLNPSQLNVFFYQYEYLQASKGLNKNAGLIAQAAGKKLTVNLTRELNEDEWARVLTECLIHHVQLKCYCLPGITLPAPLKHLQPTTQPLPTALWDKTLLPVLFIRSTDTDTTVTQLDSQLKDCVFINVSELEPFDLLGQVHGSFDPMTLKLQFNQVEKVLNKAFREQKSVILTGTLSNTLYDALVPLLLQRSYTANHSAILAIVVDDAFSHTLPFATHHQVTVAEKINALEQDAFNLDVTPLTKHQLEHECLSILKSRLRYMQQHPECLDSSKAWDGLDSLSNHITLAPFDLGQSTAKAELIINQRIAHIRKRLCAFPMLYLTGLTGVGKTTFIEKYLGSSDDLSLYLGESKQEQWAQDKSKKFRILFIDEVNIGQRQWSELEGLLKPNPSILINGVYFALDKYDPNNPQQGAHLVIIGGNPLSYGNQRQLAPLFRRHANVMIFEPMTGEFIYELILMPLFANTRLESQSQEISLLVLELYRYLVELSTIEILISTRELQLIVQLTLSAYSAQVDQDAKKIARHYIHQIGSTMIPHEHKKDFDDAFKPKQPLHAKLLAPFKLKHSNYLITPSRQEAYQLILDLLQLREFKQQQARNDLQRFGGIGGIILEGEPGIGKSELVRAVLQEHQFQEGSLAQDPDHKDLFYQVPISMRNEQKEALLIKALSNAAALLIDEINSAPLLERSLNDVLMNKNPLTKQNPDTPGVLFFGTQNPVTMAGRQKFSNAVRRRVLHYVLPNYSDEDILNLMINEGLDSAIAERMVRVFAYAVNYAKQNYLSPAPTVRDLLRLARIFSKSNNLNVLSTFYAAVTSPSLREALVSLGSDFNSKTVLRIAKCLTPETIHIFELHIDLFKQLIAKDLALKKIQFVLGFLKIMKSDLVALDNNPHYLDILCHSNLEYAAEFQTLEAQEKLRVFKMVRELSAETYARFQTFHSLIITRLIPLRPLLKALDTVTLSQCLMLMDWIFDPNLLPYLLSGEAAVQPLLTAVMQQPKYYAQFLYQYKARHLLHKPIPIALLDLYYYFSIEAAADRLAWEPILLEATPEKINQLHRWMKRYENNKSLFFHAVYSAKFYASLNNALNDNKLARLHGQLLNDSALSLFDFSKPVQYSWDRVALLSHLENKTFVVSVTSTITTLWTELRNSALLTAIYDAYSNFLNSNPSKTNLLIIATEFAAVPEGTKKTTIQQDLRSDLKKGISNYLGSFWIRTQRKNSALTLLSAINEQNNGYSELLTSIQNARNNVFTNDTETERGMHRFGSSRYYDTLNQLEETLIHYWINDKQANSSFKEYLAHYDKTRTHSRTCFSNAIRFEKSTKGKNYTFDTPLKELPGYLQALKKEMDSREMTYSMYQQQLHQAFDHAEHACSNAPGSSP